MKKKLGNCIVSGNMKSMNILRFYDLTEKKQAELIEGMDQIHKEEIANDFYINIYGSIYGIGDFLGGKFEEFEKYFNELNEKNNYFFGDIIIQYITFGMFVRGACVFDSDLENYYLFSFKFN